MEIKRYETAIIVLGVVIIYLLANVIYSVNESRKLWLDLNLNSITSEETFPNIAKVDFNGHKYNVELTSTGNVASVWFRADDQNTKNDIRALSLFSSPTTYSDAVKDVCRSKEEVEKGKAFVGCLSTVGSAACVFTTAESAGATAEICTEVWDYAIDEGFADCINKIKDDIAEKVINSKAWSGMHAVGAISRGEAKEAVSETINALCKDVIKEAESEKEGNREKPSHEPNPQPGPTPSQNQPSPIPSTQGGHVNLGDHPDNHPDHSGDHHPDIDHSSDNHSDVDHSEDNHPDVDHSEGNHPNVDHSEDNHPDVDHSEDNHPDVDHSGDNHSEPRDNPDQNRLGGGSGLGFLPNSNNSSVLKWVFPGIAAMTTIAIFFLIFFKRNSKR
jgi:hypothetical protein